MKTLFLSIIFFSFIEISSIAQSLSSNPGDKIFNANNNIYEKLIDNQIQEEQIFVHTDRNVYYPGDTLHFQSYIRKKSTGELTSYSNSMYALLFNEQQEIVDSSRFKIENALCPGYMLVPESVKPGLYRFIAFTSAMQNYNAEDAFMIDLKVESKSSIQIVINLSFDKESYFPGDTLNAVVKITGSNKIPKKNQQFEYSVKDVKSGAKANALKTDEKGESELRIILSDSISTNAQLQLKIEKPDKTSLISNFNIPVCSKIADFKFLPEGGTLIKGLYQRIGFNAANKKGESINIKGLLKDKNGRILDTISSGKYGPGSFSCIVDDGLFVELINQDNYGQTFSLEGIRYSGTCMNVKPLENNIFEVEIKSNFYNGDTVNVSGNMGRLAAFLTTLKLDRKQRFTFNTDDLPSGVMQINLSDKKNRIVAQRMVYINANKHLKFNITSDSLSYMPGKETELSISSSDGTAKPKKGLFSISVAYESFGIDPEIFLPGIEYVYNYHPYFLHNLPQQVLLDGIENLSYNDLDLLLMVFGWSRIENQTIDYNSNKNLPDYDLLNIKMKGPFKYQKRNVNLNIFSMDDFSILQIHTDDNGELILPFDSLSPNSNFIKIIPDEKNKHVIWGANVSIPINTDYFKSEKFFFPLPVFSKKDFPKTGEEYLIPDNDSIIKIPEVTIKSSFIKKYNDEYEEHYQTGNVKSIGFEDLYRYINVESVVYAVANPLFIVNIPDGKNTPGVYLIPPQSILDPYIPALIVLDGFPLYTNGWEQVRNLNARNLKSVTVLKSMEAYYRYGAYALGGVIFINTMDGTIDPEFEKRYNIWLEKSSKLLNDQLKVPFSIYRPSIEYYNLKKEDVPSSTLFKERKTIYWNSKVYFDGKEPVKISYPNLNRHGSVIVTINGISANNLVGNARYKYIIR
ncbi:MAG: hypothetical protein U0W24_00565 [Bacteroidales bacterium]